MNDAGPRHADREMLTAKQSTPVDLDLDLPGQVLRVTWADGRRDEFGLARLRAICPCAACRTEREKRSTTLLPILSTKPIDDVRVVDASLVGNYAIQFTWSDGHSTGIFDFRYLRAAAVPTDRS